MDYLRDLVQQPKRKKLELRFPRRRATDFLRVRETCISNMAKFKSVSKVKRRQKWREPESSLKLRLILGFQLLP
jgi:hypothetical protein